MMNFTDYIFVPTFLLLVIVYYQIPLSKRWIALLITSLLFYASWGLQGFFFLIGAVLVSWLTALWIGQQQEKNASKKKQKAGLLVGICILITVLILLKLKSVLPDCFDAILTPLGISYFTLSLVGYMADVFWKKEKAERNPFKLLLFAVYFPKIVEGPISRHRLSSVQLTEGHRFDYRKFCFGLQRMLWGYCKKLVIADRLAIFTGTVFGDYQNHNGAILFVAAALAAVELYCDFSGCMDIALGMSETLGINLEENFRRPFFSQSAAEFWRRWHISLGTWFKDYIYMPLAASPLLIRISGKIRSHFGRRAGKAFLMILPTAVVWILTGLWHGTGWNYVLWGVYWGLLIILSSVLDPEIRKLSALLHINTKSSGWVILRQLRTFILFVISRIIALPSSLLATASICKRILFSFAPWELVDGTLLEQGLGAPNLILAVLMIAFLWLVERSQEKGVIFRDKIAAYPIVLRWGIYLAAIFFILNFGIYGAGYDAASFVYAVY